MTSPLIDVWNVKSFDQPLLTKLNSQVQLIRDYLITSRRQFLEREASDHRGALPTNPFGRRYMNFNEEIGRDMESRTIRAWHYTRLTDDEVEDIQKNGIYPCTLDTLRRRLDAQAAKGLFSTADADALYAASPCHHREQQPGRLGKFWMVSDPQPVDDGGVKLLLANWGGESTYFWLEEERLEQLVAKIGRPRIIEIAVPLARTPDAYAAGCAVVGAVARTLGCRPERGGFDLYTTEPLGPTAILTVHTAGEPTFDKIGRDYPDGFVATP
jgi:hypothetical protein